MFNSCKQSQVFNIFGCLALILFDNKNFFHTAQSIRYTNKAFPLTFTKHQIFCLKPYLYFVKTTYRHRKWIRNHSSIIWISFKMSLILDCHQPNDVSTLSIRIYFLSFHYVELSLPLSCSNYWTYREHCLSIPSLWSAVKPISYIENLTRQQGESTNIDSIAGR